MKASWVAKVRCPDREIFWVGSFYADGRTDAKRAARLFVSAILPLDTIILAIAPGKVTLTLDGPEIGMED
jgi:hypothetical protein